MYHFEFIGPLKLSNNGHTGKYIYISVHNKWFFLFLAQLNFNNHYILKHITPQSENYKVAQLHFHWGHLHDNTTGSEHLLEGQSYPLEVFINSSIKIFKKWISI